VYPARVYSGSIRLKSAFQDVSSDNIVKCEIWFQEDLPVPGVDLSKLKPKLNDTYPNSLKQDIMSKVLDENFVDHCTLNFQMAGIDDVDETRLFY
jgi:hypothetical protein